MEEYIKNWSYKRLIQLGFGIYLFWEYFAEGRPLFVLLFGGIMSFQAIFNIGCFSTRGCKPSIDQNQKENFSENDEIDFEEVE